jgi:hypothetical protein
MSGLAAGDWVRVTRMPGDLEPLPDTGMLVRRQLEHDPATGEDRPSTRWFVRFDGLHFERAVSEADIVAQQASER